MKLSRTGKTIRNLILVLLLGALICAQRNFAPLTVGGMCRQIGRQLTMTTPEPVYVYQGHRQGWENKEDTFVIARSGPTWVSFLYESSGFHGWERSWRQEMSVENGPVLSPYAGKLYLAGDFPEEAVSARGTAAAQHITIWLDGEGNREPPEYGEVREFPLDGELLQPGIFTFPYSDPSQWIWDEDIPEEDATLAYASRNWYVIRSRDTDDNSWGTLHADIPFEITLYDAADRPLETLHFTLDTYALTATMV